jgi:hypothetical protein
MRVANSEGPRFESAQVGQQKTDKPKLVGFFFFILYFFKRIGKGPEQSNFFARLLIRNSYAVSSTLDLRIGNVISLSKEGEIQSGLA